MAKAPRRNRRKDDLSEEKAAELREIALERIGLDPAADARRGDRPQGPSGDEPGRERARRRPPRAESP